MPKLELIFYTKYCFFMINLQCLKKMILKGIKSLLSHKKLPRKIRQILKILKYQINFPLIKIKPALIIDHENQILYFC